MIDIPIIFDLYFAKNDIDIIYVIQRYYEKYLLNCIHQNASG